MALRTTKGINNTADLIPLGLPSIPNRSSKEREGGDMLDVKIGLTK